jgi:prepilin-type N-terminal cleavage/methylation domain-containing protein
MKIRSLKASAKTARRAERGTTLLEMLVAVALFAIISGVAFNLMYQQQQASQGLQGRVALNMALRNTESLLQMDLANAGNGFYQITNTSTAGSVGVGVINHVVTPGNSCATTATQTYGVNCFDQLNVISFQDPTLAVQNIPTPALTITNSTFSSSAACGSSSCVTGSVATYLTNNPSNTYAQAYSAFHVGDYLLFVKSTGAAYTVAKITAIGASNPGAGTISFGIQPTNAGGVNTLANDPFNLTACSGAAACPPTNPPVANDYLTSSFAANDYILKIVPVTYQVCNGPGSPTTSTGALYNCDQSSTSPDISNPKLWRTIQAGGVTTSSVVMEQVLGFKVGASLFNAPDPNVTNAAETFFNYDASTYTITNSGDTAFDFGAVHSVRVSLIGRTVPNTTKISATSYVYQNAFDGGPYQVQGTAIVVNPRNMNLQGY